MNLPKRTALLICLVVGWSATTRAHDPYEITSVAYLHSNRIELFVEMEFPAGMTLAGQPPVRDIAALTQFESALPRLRELAGGFFDLTAGNNRVQPLMTNVEFGVEDHIRFRLEYAPTRHRPLRFVARGLGAAANENPYGTSLTVLDMVNQKVLGQSTLLAATPTAEFPPRTEPVPNTTPTPIIAPPLATIPGSNASPESSASVTLPAAAVKSPARPNWLVATVTGAAVLLITRAFFRRRE